MPFALTLALTLLAVAPAAAQISITSPGTLTRSTHPDTTYVENPLVTSGASNGTNMVGLEGSVGFFADIGPDVNGSGGFIIDQLEPQPTFTFENIGTISASAGQAVRVNYNFELVAESFFGGGASTYDFQSTFDVVINGVQTQSMNGLLNRVLPDGEIRYPQIGSFTSTVFGADLDNVGLIFRFANITDDKGTGPLVNYQAIVPANGITLTIVPETATVSIFMGVVAIAFCLFYRRWRGRSRDFSEAL